MTLRQGQRTPPRSLKELQKTEPLERLAELREIQEAIPMLRAEAVQELLDAGWTRNAIALALGITRQAVYQWERSERARWVALDGGAVLTVSYLALTRVALSTSAETVALGTY